MSSNDKVLELNDDNFDLHISEGISIVDFWAPWCGPCRMMGPILEELPKRINCKIVKVNVDQFPALSSEYNVSAIPLLILFNDGVEKQRFVGVQQLSVLEDAVKKYSL